MIMVKRVFIGIIIMFILSIGTAYIKELLEHKGIKNVYGLYIILGILYDNIIKNYILIK